MKKTPKLSEKNKLFWKKSAAAQRVAVARDVLKQIDSKFLVPSSGDYFMLSSFDENIKVPDKLDEAFSVLKKEGVRCNVCGIGSCFASLVNLGDSFTTELAFGDTSIEEFQSISDISMRVLLRKVFPPIQLTLIERAFEISHNLTDKEDVEITSDGSKRAVSFGRKYKTDTNRLKAIMDNIIENKGTFTP